MSSGVDDPAARDAAPDDGPRRGRPDVAAGVALVVLAVAGATVAAAIAEQAVGIVDASAVYLIAVVIAASLLGTSAAVATSLVAFVIYDFLFTQPRFTLAVSDPAEWLSLLLFLIVAVVIGRLAGLLRDRAEEAGRRTRESAALVAISRDIAVAATFDEAAAHVVRRLQRDAEMATVRVTLADDPSLVVASAGTGPALGARLPTDAGPGPWSLARSPDGTSDWLRVGRSEATVPGPSPEPGGEAGNTAYQVGIEAGGATVGWIHAERPVGDPVPGRGARRLLASAADQLGVAHRRDELRAELTAAEVARQGDALRGAILDSVSHDLRTPVASIRALAGGLADPAITADDATVRATAGAIDAEAARLGDLVAGLLHMGRIQAGAVHADLEAFDLADLVETALLHHPLGPGRPTDVVVPPDLAVLADAVLADVAIGNVLDNAVAHTAPSTAVRIRARRDGQDRVELSIEDAGEGVPPESMARLFDRFYRVPPAQAGSRRGLGMGLAIARGFVEAMGGTVEAGSSDLGGLAIRIRLPAAAGEAEG